MDLGSHFWGQSKFYSWPSSLLHLINVLVSLLTQSYGCKAMIFHSLFTSRWGQKCCSFTFVFMMDEFVLNSGSFPWNDIDGSNPKSNIFFWAWWCVPTISAFRREKERQEDQEFKVTLSYLTLQITHLRPVWKCVSCFKKKCCVFIVADLIN